MVVLCQKTSLRKLTQTKTKHLNQLIKHKVAKNKQGKGERKSKENSKQNRKGNPKQLYKYKL